MIGISIYPIVSSDTYPDYTFLAEIIMTKTIANDFRSIPPSRDNAPKPKFPEINISNPNKIPKIIVSEGQRVFFDINCSQ